jgi:AmmeMemoRadiSam system protein B
MLVPHGSFARFGAVAAAAYATWLADGASVARVVLVGPSHRHSFKGLGFAALATMRTPLGEVAIDNDLAASLPNVSEQTTAHIREQCLSVHLPFVQRVFGNAKLVPLLVSEATPQQVLDVLAALSTDAHTVVVVTSNLSQYLDAQLAQSTDAGTLDRILSLSFPLSYDCACGSRAIHGLLALAKQRALTPKLFDVRHYGESHEEKSGVIGYASIGFYG